MSECDICMDRKSCGSRDLKIDDETITINICENCDNSFTYEELCKMAIEGDWI